MAKIELRHLDYTCDNYATVEEWGVGTLKVSFYDTTARRITPLFLDKSTAIKFAKTLRTEINKIKN
jgi:hypothetical protein